MSQSKQKPSLAGSFRLFRVAGITVYLHWSWFLIAVIAVQTRGNAYVSQVWNVLEYLTLFVIVLLHEFGHSLACRQVGGQANEIVLWPLGGIAFVNPPPRPGAWLWSIAAGPLVNVVLAPITFGAGMLAVSQNLQVTHPDAEHFVRVIMFMNLGLLIFNMLPIYPLDGGQILHSILWFLMGRGKSLMVASIVGMVGACGLIAVAIWLQSVWIAVLVLFAISRAWIGVQQARLLIRIENAPRHADVACPSCHFHPFAGDFWQCAKCGARFDMFLQRAACPGCGTQFDLTPCPECQRRHPIDEWFAAAQRLVEDGSR